MIKCLYIKGSLYFLLNFTNISGESDLQLLNQNEEINKMDELKNIFMMKYSSLAV